MSRFAKQVNEPEEQDWLSAREAYRRGELTSVFVTSVEVATASPEDNPVDTTATNAIEMAA